MLFTVSMPSFSSAPLIFYQLETRSHQAAGCQFWALKYCCVFLTKCYALTCLLFFPSLEGSTKSALDMLSKVMAMELGPHKVGFFLRERKV